MRIFIGGVMQASNHGKGIVDQGYREQIATALQAGAGPRSRSSIRSACIRTVWNMTTHPPKRRCSLWWTWPPTATW